MSRVVTFGRMPSEIPEGNFIEVSFPELARLDEGTNEGWMSRVLASDGADSRELPRTISFQELDTFGHDMAAASGSIWEITVDGETGNLSGRGFMADTEWGHKAAAAIRSKSLHHNSIDLAEVTKTSIKEEGDYWSDDYKVTLTFDEWKFGKTTLVALPAFANAHAVLGDELKASLADEGITVLVVDCPSDFSAHSALEAAASADTRPSWDHFHVPEAESLTAITVHDVGEDGWIPIFGHLADWKKLHKNASGQWVYPPRATDGYAHFNASKVLTDNGFVKVGPVTLLGGHVSLQQAIEDVENTWADVRVVDGKLGPWVSGVVRPHVAADMAKTYAARASQISGLWPDGQTLRLISSVNAAGFPVLEEATDGEFALAASLTVEPMPMPQALKSFREMNDDDQRTVREWVAEALAHQSDIPTIILNVEGGSTSTVDGVITVEEAVEDDESLEQAAVEERARLLAEGGLSDLLDVE